MVAVSALVVEPSGGIAFFRPFRLVGRSVTQIIFRAGDKFRKRIFGKIMKKPLKRDPGKKTVPHHSVAVLCNGYKMLYGMRHLYITSLHKNTCGF